MVKSDSSSLKNSPVHFNSIDAAHQGKFWGHCCLRHIETAPTQILAT
jgi:hypothetical protein